MLSFDRFVAAAAVAAALFTAPLTASAAQSGVYKLDPTHASVIWSVAHLGLSQYTARFDKFDIQLTLDADDPSKSTVSATIDPTSVNTGFPGDKDFDGEIATGKKFLNAGDHPEITFQSTKIEMVGDEMAKITGELNMLGVTQEVVLDAKLIGFIESHPFAKKPAIGFAATTTLDRTAFGLDFLAGHVNNNDQLPRIVSPEVTVTINAEFIKTE